MFSTNPFLRMLVAVEDEGVIAENAQPQPQMQQPILDPPWDLPGGGEEMMMQVTPVNLKLLEFWPHAPGLRFVRVECRFEIIAFPSERQKFCCVADALTYEAALCPSTLLAHPGQVPPSTSSHGCLRQPRGTVLCLIKRRGVGDSRWPFSAESWTACSSDTQPLTGSCWRATRQSGIFDGC
jgi:hypothetical protein